MKTPADRNKLTAEQRNYRNWPAVQIDLLTEEKRRVFESRKTAVERYLDQGDEETIRSETGLSRQEYHRLLCRCLSGHADGRIWGYRALIPGIRVKSYRREMESTSQGERRGGLAGAFSQFLEAHPEIRELIEKLFFEKADKGELPERKMLLKDIQQQMLGAAKAEGVSVYQYPFCTKTRGIRSLEKYLKNLYDLHFRPAVSAREGKEAARRMGAGKMGMKLPASRPFEQVELDAHRLDAFFEITTFRGRYGSKQITSERRPWLLALIERFSRAILAYRLVWAFDIDQFDVLRLFRSFLTPWEKPNLANPDLQYIDGAGLPSSEIPVCRWALFDELYCDNALAFCAAEVKRFATRLIGSAVVFGRFRSPNDRPFIERFFKTLEERSFHRMPNTTGGSPKDVRRGDPKEAARKYHLDEVLLNEILAMAMANYNATEHQGLGNRSPLEVLRNVTADQPLRMLLDRTNMAQFNLIREVRVKGDLAERRPYVNYQYVPYSSAALKGMPSMIGQKLLLSIDYDHLESVTAYLPDGALFGQLTPKPPEWQRPHTIEERKIYYRAALAADRSDSIHELVAHLPERAANVVKPDPEGPPTKSSPEGLLKNQRGDRETILY